jgi:hypothetical protein
LALCPSLAFELPWPLPSQPSPSLSDFVSTPAIGPRDPYIVSLTASRNLAELSLSRIWEHNSSVVCRRCGSISDQVLNATIVMLQLRCSSTHNSAKRVFSCGEKVIYLAFKVNSCRTYQITFVVRLLHRRGRLVAHHGLESRFEIYPYRVAMLKLSVFENFVECGSEASFVNQPRP